MSPARAPLPWKPVLLAALLVPLAACTNAVSASATLAEAQGVIGHVRPTPDCAALVTEAKEALDYARFERGAGGEGRLAAFHADVALLKARQAEAACAGIDR